MPCYYPISCWRAKEPNKNGKYPMVFNPDGAQIDEPLEVPCGRCIGCRLSRSRDWAIRSMHESSQHKYNCFLTLTYADEHLPPGQNLDPRSMTLFMKRYRTRFRNHKIRFYLCGEYGENTDLNSISTLGRPHYHLLIFGHEFNDKELYKTTGTGEYLYTSKTLEKLWPYGHAVIGDVTFETAGYVARYCTKKIGGEMAWDHYQRTDRTTGETTFLHPEFSRSSNQPGIGGTWYQKYKNDLAKGYLTTHGVKVPSPRYYLKKFQDDEPILYDKLKIQTAQTFDRDHPDNKIGRLRVREQVLLDRTKQLKRNQI